MVELLKTQLMEGKKTSYPMEAPEERTELERIALKFKGQVQYKRVHPSLEGIDGNEFVYGTEREFLYYHSDDFSITARNEMGQNDRTIEYWVDETKLDLYISQLSKSQNKFIRKVVEALKKIQFRSDEDKTQEPPLVGRNFKVDDYNDLSELIRLHIS